MLDVDKMADALLAGTRALIAKELAPLRAENERLAARLAEVEAREIPEMPELPEMPDFAGMLAEVVDAIPEHEPVVLPDVAAMVAEAVAEAVAAIPPASDGKDADMEVVSKMVSDAVAAIPAPEPVVLPDFAKMIADAMPEPVHGKDADMEAVAKMVSDAVAAIPAPVIPAPIPGKDGLSIAEVKQNDDGELIVKMTNGETINAGLVRGAPGIGFDDLTVDHDGERDVVLRFARGDVVKEFPLLIPAIIDRGVWAPGEFAKGDAVTWGGSLWIAQEATEGKPGADKSWRLAVKKGRDANPSVRAD